MEALKDKYLSHDYYRQLAHDIKQAYPALNAGKFYHDAVADLDSRELMARIQHTTGIVHQHLPHDYRQALKVLYAVGEVIQTRLGEHSNSELGSLFIHHYISQYGQHDYARSITALRDLTHLCSSEFAIRDYLLLDCERTLGHMKSWVEDQNAHIRRLASEGCRPRLPWAKQVPALIKHRGATWSILDALKQDDALYVRKSVANHINDISKDHADWLPKQLKHWDKQHKHTQWIIKHGCRTLIKRGHAPTLKLLGFGNADHVRLTKLTLSAPSLHIGDTLAFTFNLSSTQQRGQAQPLVIDYKIHYMKKSGELKAKVFKLKTVNLAAGDSIQLSKQHHFTDYTTRKHYPGRHELEITVNGISLARKQFELLH